MNFDDDGYDDAGDDDGEGHDDGYGGDDDTSSQSSPKGG